MNSFRLSSVRILSIFLCVFQMSVGAPVSFAAGETESAAQTPTGLVPVKPYEDPGAQAVAAPDPQTLANDSGNFLGGGNPLSPASPSIEKPAADTQSSPAEVTIDESLLQHQSYDVSLSSSDTYYGTYAMWGFDRVNAQKAWTLTRGDGISIAVIDTGLDMNHEDILGNVFTNTGEIAGNGIDDDGNGYIDDVNGWNFVNNNNNPTDDNGHGTHVSGIAAAVADNNKGIAGIAPNAKIIPVKVLDSNGSGGLQNVINGIKYAANIGAQVINMSLGILKRYLSTSWLNAFQDAINYATNKGAIVVTAAGNDSVDTSLEAPAGLNNTIAVGATDSSNKRAYFSNKNPDLVAPGVTIGSLYNDGGYVYMSGTSMASPFVAGAVALIRSYYDAAYKSLGYTGQQIYNDVYTRLTKGALDLPKKGYDSSFGYGLLDAYKALTISTSAGAASLVKSIGAGSGGHGFFGAASFAGDFANFVSEGVPAFTAQIGNWYRVGAFDAESSHGKHKKKQS